MNDIAWGLLSMKNHATGQILDAGCGVGGTSIYLAKKYPQMFFTGITIVPSHVEMAEKLAKKFNVTSKTQFFERNYCHTSFPNQTFDGIIAIESVIYAHNHEELISEFSRVLKSGGHIAILDGFRTDKPIPTSLKKIYQIWLDGRALIDVDSVNTFTLCMKKKGFQNIIVTDISSHVFSSYFLGIFVDSALFVPTLIKSLFHNRNHKSTKVINGFLAVTVATALLVLNGYFKYYSVSATK
ncbi:MAG: class I SAM-dependent methyltransferase [Candidatus Thermoplasmatota archaeon]|nr:class I SAM-dependent methyltransferase [Candidatus Thermoplasmatota archaeon]